MAAAGRQQPAFARRDHRRAKVHARYRTARSLADAGLIDADHDDRLAQPFLRSTGDDADDARMPAPARDHGNAGVCGADGRRLGLFEHRSEEHTSELQSLMRISYAVFCLKKKNNTKQITIYDETHDMHTSSDI